MYITNNTIPCNGARNTAAQGDLSSGFFTLRRFLISWFFHHSWQWQRRRGWAVLAILCPHTLVSARDVSQRHSSAPPPRPTVKTVPHKNDHRNLQCVKFKLLYYTSNVFNGHCPSNRSRWFKNTQYYTLWCEPKHCPILWINKCQKVQNIFENKFVNQIIKCYFMFQQNKMYMIHTRYQLFMIIKESHEYVLWSTMSI